MATALKLRSDIKKLKKALDTKGISASIKDKLKSQLAKAENELASMKKGKKPPKSSTGGTKTALSKLQSIIKKKKYGAYRAQGVDLKKDADRPALPTGKRKSKSGNTYYEYRANRIDVKQPPKRYPKLEDGGMMAKGGALDSVIDNIVSNALKQIDKAENSAEDFQYLLNGVIRKLQGFSKKADGGYMADGGSVSDTMYAIEIKLEDGKEMAERRKRRNADTRTERVEVYPTEAKAKEALNKIKEKGEYEGIKVKKVEYVGVYDEDNFKGGGYMAGGGNVSKKYEKIEGTNYELKIQVYYDKGGMNYFTSRPEARGYYLSVSPVQVERRENGIMVESYAAFSGIKALVLPVQRQSPKAEKQAEELAVKMMPELKEQVTSNLKRKLGLMAEGGVMETREILSKEQQMAKGGQLDDLLSKQSEFLAQLTDIKLEADLETEEGVLNYRNQIAPIKEKLSLIENELEELGYEAYEKGGYMAKGGMTLGDISKKYDKNEDINYHTENVVLLATHFGTESELRDAKTIKAKHDAIGHLPRNLYEERNELGEKLYERMIEQIRENGMGAKPKKMAYGGYMAQGGELHRSQEEKFKYGGYMAGGGEIKDQYEGREPEDIWNSLSKMQRSHFLFDHASEIEARRGEDKGELKGKEIRDAMKMDFDSLDKYIRITFENHIREGQYKYGGYMADGGMSQGYDDREDERLGMRDGKIADKDFVGTHSQMEHSRRDDAQFEERMAMGGALEHGIKKGDHIMVVRGNMLGIKNEITGEIVTLNIETGERKESKE